MRKWFPIITACLCTLAWFFMPMPSPALAKDTFLAGRMLVASEKLRDAYFRHAVVYMIQHNAGGALGLIVNRKIGVGSLAEMLADLGRKIKKDRKVNLYFGGPVSIRKVFVLHSGKFQGKGTLAVPDGLSMTGDTSIIDAIADGHEPKLMRFMMGYAGWGAGQLENEIERGDWLNATSDNALIFGASDDTEDVWRRALEKAGLTL